MPLLAERITPCDEKHRSIFSSVASRETEDVRERKRGRSNEWWAAGCARGWCETALGSVPRRRRTLVRERARHLLPERQELDPRHVGRAVARAVVDQNGQALV